MSYWRNIFRTLVGLIYIHLLLFRAEIYIQDVFTNINSSIITEFPVLILPWISLRSLQPDYKTCFNLIGNINFIFWKVIPNVPCTTSWIWEGMTTKHKEMEQSHRFAWKTEFTEYKVLFIFLKFNMSLL